MPAEAGIHCVPDFMGSVLLHPKALGPRLRGDDEKCMGLRLRHSKPYPLSLFPAGEGEGRTGQNILRRLRTKRLLELDGL